LRTSSKLLRELGFKRILNAGGHYTIMRGSCLEARVLQAMDEAADYWIDMRKLELNAGKMLSSYLECEDGLVTSGAYAANAMAAETSFAIAEEKNHALSDPEIIIQSSHITEYAQSFTTSGIRIKQITRQSENESLRKHVTESTIALVYVINETELEFSIQETIDVGTNSGLPVIVDAAVVDPPIRGIREVLRYEPGIVTVSGGKGFNGPNGTGILLGKKKMISKARDIAFPNYGPGRGMKVSKEEIVGLMMAVSIAASTDEEAMIQDWKTRIELIRNSVLGLPNIRTEVLYPWRLNFPQPVPRLVIWIDREDGKERAARIRNALLESSPSVFTRPLDQISGPKNRLLIDPRVLGKRDAKKVGDNIRLQLKRFLS
jgi:L-seryl-tRNA(Ser) seleniumtransferase